MNNLDILKSISQNTKYLKWYISLVSKKYDNITYSEKHHILPKSLGGDNTQSNIVRIPGRIHFICHKLLVKMLVSSKHRKSMIFALNMLAKANNQHQHRHQISSRQYEVIRSQIAEMVQGENSGTYGSIPWNKGVTHTAETKKKISDRNSAYYATHSGIRLGAKHTEETKEKMRGPKTEIGKANMSAAAKKKPRLICCHCGKNVTTSNHTRWHGVNCKNAPCTQ